MPCMHGRTLICTFFADPSVDVFLRDSRLQSRLTPIRPSPLETRRLCHIRALIRSLGKPQKSSVIDLTSVYCEFMNLNPFFKEFSLCIAGVPVSNRSQPMPFGLFPLYHLIPHEHSLDRVSQPSRQQDFFIADSNLQFQAFIVSTANLNKWYILRTYDIFKCYFCIAGFGAASLQFLSPILFTRINSKDKYLSIFTDFDLFFDKSFAKIMLQT